MDSECTIKLTTFIFFHLVKGIFNELKLVFTEHFCLYYLSIVFFLLEFA